MLGPETGTEWKSESVTDGRTYSPEKVLEMFTHLKMSQNLKKIDFNEMA